MVLGWRNFIFWYDCCMYSKSYGLNKRKAAEKVTYLDSDTNDDYDTDTTLTLKLSVKFH